MKKAKKHFLALGFLAFSISVAGQISLAPSFVFIDSNSGVGNLFVSNNSQQAHEVDISFLFGYPDSDTEGNLVMNYQDSVAYLQFGLDEMIRAFPRSFILGPGEQRTVRLHVIPAERRKEGFFFTRMKVLAKPQTPEVTGQIAEGIGTKISFNFEQVTAVFYHRGIVSTGILVKKLNVRQNEGVLELRPHLQRTGNAPFLGSMFAKLKDARGNVVAQAQGTTTAYFDVIRRIDLPLSEVKPGTYTIELTFETRRNDMAATDLVQAPPLMHKSTVVVE